MRPTSSGARDGLHPRSLHRAPYDFPALIAAHPVLAAHVRPTGFGADSIDFADPAAVKALNAALLAHHYGIRDWDIPPGYLCPPVPGRADYLHHIADLLAKADGGRIPRGERVTGLDIGTGANAIYPLLGHALYGWRFIATELDAAAAHNAEVLLGRAPATFDLRSQHHPDDILANTLASDEWVDFTLCNPPFHGSAAEAAAGNARKRRNLGLADGAALNFGGRHHELWCEGGEIGFIRRMIRQSEPLANHAGWFTSLVSNADHLPAIERWLRQAGVRQQRRIEMRHGQKTSRIVAWSFHQAPELAAIAARHRQAGKG